MMKKPLLLLLVALTTGGFELRGAPVPVDPRAPEWRSLTEKFKKNPDTRVDFVERRKFPFRREVVELSGEARVSLSRGLSLHYQEPQERIVIVDSRGVMFREYGKEKAAPDDDRAETINAAQLAILQFDLARLEKDFVVTGEQAGDGWKLVLEPKEKSVRRAFAQLTVEGREATVTHIEMRHGDSRWVEIRLTAPVAQGDFSAEELRQYFR